jgi:dTDP-4-dehydrorhamnose reductase
VGDQIGCPTYAQDIARSIVEIAPQLNSRKDNDIYHYCGDRPCSWYDFANAIFDQAMTNNLKIPSIVNSIETSAYPTPAKRPAFSVLDCSKIENEFGVLLSNWQEGIRQVIRKLEQ